MKKEEVINKAQNFSKNPLRQEGYIAGFQACCNIIRKGMSECYNDEFLTKMEEMSEVSFMEFEQY
ncbi:MAG: hypothetical protein BGO29_02710 [Bacteroidales bacterium 36-12]|nr:MAG: hypothetical protein BGO29_02710 [Bacteroidales bacterium 36-12]